MNENKLSRTSTKMCIQQKNKVQRCQALGIVPNTITDQPKRLQYTDHRPFNLKFCLRRYVKCIAHIVHRQRESQTLPIARICTTLCPWSMPLNTKPINSRGYVSYKCQQIYISMCVWSVVKFLLLSLCLYIWDVSKPTFK